MIKIVQMIYSNYQCYFLIMAALLGSFLCLHVWKREEANIKRTTVVCLLSVLGDIFWGMIVYHQASSAFIYLKIPHAVEFVLKYAVLVLGGVIVPLLSWYVFSLCTKVKQKKWIDNNKCGICTFLFFIVSFALNASSEIENWVSLWYAADYSMGIGSRFFIGSLLHLFYPEFLPKESVYRFVVVTVILLILIVSILLNNLMNAVAETEKKAVVFLVALFLASPGSIAGFWQTQNMGRLELYGLLLSLFGVLVFEKTENAYVKYGMITLLSCLSVAIYQGYVFLYYAIVLFVIVYDCLQDKKDILQRRILGALNALITGIVFLYFQFFSSCNFETYEEMGEALQRRTDMEITSYALHFELFSPVSAAYNEINIPFFSGMEFPREKTFITMALLTPLLCVLIALFLKCFKESRAKKLPLRLTPFFYAIVLLLTVLPQYILNVDWGRWMLATNIVVFFEIFYLIYKRNDEMRVAVNAFTQWVEKHPLLCVFTLIYLASLGKYNARLFLQPVDTIANWLYEHNFIVEREIW